MIRRRGVGSDIRDRIVNDGQRRFGPATMDRKDDTMRKTLHMATLTAALLAAPAMAFAQAGSGGTAPVVGAGHDAVPPPGTTGVHKLPPTADTVHNGSGYHHGSTGAMTTHRSEGTTTNAR